MRLSTTENEVKDEMSGELWVVSGHCGCRKKKAWVVVNYESRRLSIYSSYSRDHSKLLDDVDFRLIVKLFWFTHDTAPQEHPGLRRASSLVPSQSQTQRHWYFGLELVKNQDGVDRHHDSTRTATMRDRRSEVIIFCTDSRDTYRRWEQFLSDETIVKTSRIGVQHDNDDVEEALQAKAQLEELIIQMRKMHELQLSEQAAEYETKFQQRIDDVVARKDHEEAVHTLSQQKSELQGREEEFREGLRLAEQTIARITEENAVMEEKAKIEIDRLNDVIRQQELDKQRLTETLQSERVTVEILRKEVQERIMEARTAKEEAASPRREMETRLARVETEKAEMTTHIAELERAVATLEADNQTLAAALAQADAENAAHEEELHLIGEAVGQATQEIESLRVYQEALRDVHGLLGSELYPDGDAEPFDGESGIATTLRMVEEVLYSRNDAHTALADARGYEATIISLHGTLQQRFPDNDVGIKDNGTATMLARLVAHCTEVDAELARVKAEREAAEAAKAVVTPKQSPQLDVLHATSSTPSSEKEFHKKALADIQAMLAKQCPEAGLAEGAEGDSKITIAMLKKVLTKTVTKAKESSSRRASTASQSRRDSSARRSSSAKRRLSEAPDIALSALTEALSRVGQDDTPSLSPKPSPSLPPVSPPPHKQLPGGADAAMSAELTEFQAFPPSPVGSQKSGGMDSVDGSGGDQRRDFKKTLVAVRLILAGALGTAAADPEGTDAPHLAEQLAALYKAATAVDTSGSGTNDELDAVRAVLTSSVFTDEGDREGGARSTLALVETLVAMHIARGTAAGEAAAAEDAPLTDTSEVVDGAAVAPSPRREAQTTLQVIHSMMHTTLTGGSSSSETDSTLAADVHDTKHMVESLLQRLQAAETRSSDAVPAPSPLADALRSVHTLLVAQVFPDRETLAADSDGTATLAMVADLITLHRDAAAARDTLAQAAADRMADTCSKLESRLTDAETTATALRAQVGTERAQHDETARKLADVEGAVAALREQVAAERRQQGVTAGRLEEVERTAGALREQVDAEREQHGETASRLAAAEAVAAELRRAVDSKGEERAEAAARRADAEATAAALRTQIEVEKTQHGVTAERLAEAEATAAALRAQVGAEREQHELTARKLAAAEGTVDALQRQIDAEKAQHATTAGRLAEVEASAGALSVQIAAEKEEHARTAGRLAAAEGAAAAGRGEADAEKAAHGATAGRLADAEEVARALRGRIDAERAEHDATAGRLAAAEESTAALRGQVDAEREQHGETARKLAEVEGASAALRGEVEARTGEHNAMVARLREMEAAAAALRGQMETDAAVQVSAEEANAELRAEIEGLQAECARLREMVEDAGEAAAAGLALDTALTEEGAGAKRAAAEAAGLASGEDAFGTAKADDTLRASEKSGRVRELEDALTAAEARIEEFESAAEASAKYPTVREELATQKAERLDERIRELEAIVGDAGSDSDAEGPDAPTAIATLTAQVRRLEEQLAASEDVAADLATRAEPVVPTSPSSKARMETLRAADLAESITNLETELAAEKLRVIELEEALVEARAQVPQGLAQGDRDAEAVAALEAAVAETLLQIADFDAVLAAEDAPPAGVALHAQWLAGRVQRAEAERDCGEESLAELHHFTALIDTKPEAQKRVASKRQEAVADKCAKLRATLADAGVDVDTAADNDNVRGLIRQVAATRAAADALDRAADDEPTPLAATQERVATLAAHAGELEVALREQAAAIAAAEEEVKAIAEGDDDHLATLALLRADHTTARIADLEAHLAANTEHLVALERTAVLGASPASQMALLAGRLRKWAARVDALERDLANATARAARVEALRAAAAEAANARARALTARIDELEAGDAAHGSAKSFLAETVKALTKQVGDLERDLAACQTRVQHLTERLAEEKQQRGAADDAVTAAQDDLRVQLAAADDKLATERALHMDELSALQDSLDSANALLETRKDDSSAALTRLEEELAQSEAARAAAELRASDAEASLLEVENKMSTMMLRGGGRSGSVSSNAPARVEMLLEEVKGQAAEYKALLEVQQAKAQSQEERLEGLFAELETAKEEFGFVLASLQSDHDMDMSRLGSLSGFALQQLKELTNRQRVVAERLETLETAAVQHEVLSDEVSARHALELEHLLELLTLVSELYRACEADACDTWAAVVAATDDDATIRPADAIRRLHTERTSALDAVGDAETSISAYADQLLEAKASRDRDVEAIQAEMSALRHQNAAAAADKERLQTAMDEANDRIEHLDTEMAALNDLARDLKNLNYVLDEKLQQMTSDNEAAITRVGELETANEELTEKLAEAEGDVASQKANAGVLEDECRTLEGENTLLAEAKAALEADVTALREQEAEQQRAVADLRDDLARVEEEKEQKNGEIRLLKASRNESQDELENYGTRIEELQGDLIEANARCRALQSDVEELQERNEKLAEEVADLQQEKVASASDLTGAHQLLDSRAAEVADLTAEMGRLRNTLDVVQNEFATSQEALMSRASGAEEERDVVAAELKRVEEAMAEQLDARADECAQLRTDAATADVRIAALTEDVAALEREVGAQGADATQRACEASEAAARGAAEVTSLRELLDVTCEAHTDASRGWAAAIAGALERTAAMEGEAAVLSDELAAAQERTEALAADVEQAKAMHGELTSLLDHAKADLEDNIAKLADAQAELEASNRTLDALRGELAEEGARANDLEDEVARAEERAEAQAAEVARLSDVVSGLESQVGTTKETAASLETDLAHAGEEAVMLQEERDALLEEKGRLVRDLKTRGASVEELAQQIAALKDEHAAAAAEAERVLAAKLDAAGAETATLEAKIADLTSDVRGKEQRVAELEGELEAQAAAAASAATAAERRAKQLQDDLAAETDRADEATAEAERVKKTLRDTQKTHGKEADELRDAQDMLEDDLQRAKRLASEKSRAAARLEEELSERTTEVHALKAERAALEEKLSDATARLDTLTREADRLRRAVADATEALETALAEADQRHAKTLAARTQQLQADLAERDEELAQARAAHQEVKRCEKTLRGEIEALNDKLLDAQELLDKAQKTTHIQETARSAAEAQLAEVTGQYEALLAKGGDASIEVSTLRREIERVQRNADLAEKALSQEVDSLSHRLEAAMNDAAEERQKHQDAFTSAEGLRRENALLSSALEATETRRKTETDALRRMTDDAAADLETARRQLKEQGDVERALRLDLDTIKRDVISAEQSHRLNFAELESDKDYNMNALEAAKRSLHNKSEECNALSTEVEEATHLVRRMFPLLPGSWPPGGAGLVALQTPGATPAPAPHDAEATPQVNQSLLSGVTQTQAGSGLTSLLERFSEEREVVSSKFDELARRIEAEGAEKEALRRQVLKFKDDVTELDRSLHDAMATNERLASDLSLEKTKARDAHELRVKCEELTSTLDASKAHGKRLADRVHELEERLGLVEAENVEVESNAHGADAKMKRMAERVRALEDEIATAMAEGTSSAARAKKLQDRLGLLEQELQAEAAKSADAAKQLAAAEERGRRYADRVRQLEQAVFDGDEGRDVLQAQLAAAEGKVKRLTDRVKQLEEELTADVSITPSGRSERQHTILQERVKALEADLVDAAAAKDSLQGAADARVRNLEALVQQLRDEVTDVSAGAAQREAQMREERRELQSRLAAMEDSTDDTAQPRVQELKARIAAAETELAQAEAEKEAAVKELRQEKRSLTARIGALEEELEELQAAQGEQERGRESTRVQQMAARLQRSEDQLTKVEDELQEKLAAFRQEKRALNERVKDLEYELSCAQASTARVPVPDSAGVSPKSAEDAPSVSVLTRRVRQLEEDIALRQSRIDLLEEEAAQSTPTAQLAVLDQRMKRKTERMQQLEVDLAAAHTRIAELEDEMSNHSSAAISTSAQTHIAQKKTSRLAERVKRLEEELAEANARVADLETQLAEVEALPPSPRAAAPTATATQPAEDKAAKKLIAQLEDNLRTARAEQQKKVAHLEATVEAAQAEVAAAEAREARERENAARLSTQVKRVEEELETVVEQQAAAEKKCAQLRGELKVQTAKVADVEVELYHMQNSPTAEEQRQKEKTRQLSAKVADLEAQVAQHEGDVDVARAQERRERERAERLAAEVERLERDIATAASADTERTAQHREEKRRLTVTVSELEDRIADMDSTSRRRSIVNEAGALRAMEDANQALAEAHERTVRTLQQQVKELEVRETALQEQVDAALRGADELRSELRVAKREAAAAGDDLKAAEAERERLAAKIKGKLGEEEAKWVEEAEKLRSERRAAAERVATLEDELHTALEDASRLRARATSSATEHQDELHRIDAEWSELLAALEAAVGITNPTSGRTLPARLRACLARVQPDAGTSLDDHHVAVNSALMDLQRLVDQALGASRSRRGSRYDVFEGPGIDMDILTHLSSAIRDLITAAGTHAAARAADGTTSLLADERAARERLTLAYEASLFAERTAVEVRVRRCAEGAHEAAAYYEHLLRTVVADVHQLDGAAGAAADAHLATPYAASPGDLAGARAPSAGPGATQTPWVVKGWGDAATPHTLGTASPYGTAAAATARDDMAREVEWVGAACKRLCSVLRAKEAAVVALEDDVAALRGELAQLAEERESRERQGTDLAARVRELQVELEEAHTATQHWRGQCAALETEGRTGEEVLQARVDELLLEISTLHTTEMELQTSVTTLTRQLQDAELRLGTKESVIADYDAISVRQKEEADDLREQVAQLNHTLMLKERDLLHVRSELEAAQAFIEEAEDDRAELIAKAQELQAIVRMKVAEDEDTERRNQLIDQHNRGVEEMWKKGGGTVPPGGVAPAGGAAAATGLSTGSSSFAAVPPMQGGPMPPPRLNSSSFHPINLYP